MYKKPFFLTCLLTIICSDVNYLCAQQRTKQELDSIANSVFHHKNAKAASAPLEMKLKSSDVLQNDQLVNREAFYIYSPITGGEESFVIVSNDKRMPAVLGYSENSRFDFNDMPVGIKSFLEKISLEASFLIDTNSATTTRTAGTNNPVVFPLLGERCWGQDEPFNSNCSYYDPPKHYPTGCVATSLAQIMAMHKFPEYYEWDKMLNIYEKGKYTQEQANAVAELMIDIDDAIEAKYNPDGSTSSNNFKAVEALVNEFGYDKECKILKKDSYTEKEWIDILNNELLSGRPICYSGEGTGGHSFVIDGMNEKGLYHINWGWNGLCNGYFYIHNLTPDVESDYSWDNEAIVNIQPEDGSIITQPINMFGDRIISDEGIGIFSKTTKIYAKINYFCNYGAIPFVGKVQLMLTSEDNTLISLLGNPIIEGGEDFLIGTPYNYNISGRLPKDLPDGHYRVYVGVQQEGYEEWKIVRMDEAEGTPTKSHLDLILKGDYYSLGTGKSPDEKHCYELFCKDLDKIDRKLSRTISRNSNLYLTQDEKMKIYNFGDLAFSGIYQLLLCDEKGNLVLSFGDSIEVDNLIASNYITNAKDSKIGGSIPDSVPNGRYRLYIGAKGIDDDNWTYVENRDEESPSYVTLVVRDSHIRLGNRYEEPEFSFSSVLTDTIQTLQQGEEYKNALKITNTSTQNTTFSYYVCINKQKVYRSKKLEISAGATIIDSVKFTMPVNLDNGSYCIDYYYTEDNSPLFGEKHTVKHDIVVGPDGINTDIFVPDNQWATVKVEENTLHISTHIDVIQWDVISTIGTIVAQGSRETGTINLYVPDGVYILHGYGKNGRVHTMKFVKK